MGVINYGRTDDLIVIEVRDYSGAKIESFVIQSRDKKKYAKTLKYLEDKYGFSPEIDVEDSPNSEKEEDFDNNWWA